MLLTLFNAFRSSFFFFSFFGFVLKAFRQNSFSLISPKFFVLRTARSTSYLLTAVNGIHFS